MERLMVAFKYISAELDPFVAQVLNTLPLAIDETVILLTLSLHHY